MTLICAPASAARLRRLLSKCGTGCVGAERAAAMAAWEADRSQLTATWDTEKADLMREIRKLRDILAEKEKLTGATATAVKKALVSADRVRV